ncbi:MAG: hypothetical protein U0524_03655 [Candidatus Saccharimonadales bacterium]
MNLTVELQSENVPEPMLAVELGDREAKLEMGRVLGWVQQHPEVVTPDTPALMEVMEHPDEHGSGIHEIQEQLQNEDTPVFEGTPGKAALEALHAVARSTDRNAPQIPAIRMLNEVNSPLKEKAELPYRVASILEKLNRDSEAEGERRLASKLRIEAVVHGEKWAPAQPDPKWIDRATGQEIPNNQYMRLYNAEETIAAERAVEMLKSIEAQEGRTLQTDFAQMNRNLQEGKTVFDLRGYEATLVRFALEEVASGHIMPGANMSKEYKESVRLQAQRMLEVRAQPSDKIEVVDMAPPEFTLIQGGAVQQEASEKLKTAA